MPVNSRVRVLTADVWEAMDTDARLKTLWPTRQSHIVRTDSIALRTETSKILGNYELKMRSNKNC